MRALSLAQLATLVGAPWHGTDLEQSPQPAAAPSQEPGAVWGAESVAIDSRRIGRRAVFFALPGDHTDGHRFVGDAFAAGAIAAVVRRDFEAESARGLGPLIRVDDPLLALQRLAADWRQQLSGQVLAITGSNGKTVVKDALLHLLSDTFTAGGSPGSFNSQLGVPLSLLRLPAELQIAVVEAGISAPGQMDPLEAMIAPELGILTNIGLAHLASFGDRRAILNEKLRLFRRISAPGWVLVPARAAQLAGLEPDQLGLSARLRTWGPGGEEDLPHFVERRLQGEGFAFRLELPDGTEHRILTATSASELVDDLEMAAVAAHLLGVPGDSLARGLDGYAPPRNRMEIWHATGRGALLINDTCSSDPVSVRAALRAFDEIAESRRRIFVFGGMGELGDAETREHEAIGKLAAEYGVDPLVLVGPGSELDATAMGFQQGTAGRVLRLDDARDLEKALGRRLESNDAILLKGPRRRGIDRAASDILEAMAPSRLLVDLGAIADNIGVFRRHLGPDRKILAMVKALAYGSDAVRLALDLQRAGVDSFGVSMADEGVALRRAGVDLPILATLVTAEEATKVVSHRLTPVVYSPELVASLEAAASAAGRILPVHLEVDTGMGRLGVLPEGLVELAHQVQRSPHLEIEGVMTHFSSADDPSEDAHTHDQLSRFETCLSALRDAGFDSLVRHAAATAAAIRFPESRFDMVRIGLGLYGIYPSAAVAKVMDLRLAVTLLSRITEVRRLPVGATVGYSRTYRVEDRVEGRVEDRAEGHEGGGLPVGVVPFGYHDGLPWRLSNLGTVMITGQPAPILGRVSMDSMVVDLSQAPDTQAGTDVLIWGEHQGSVLRPELVAEQSGTIVYELLSRLGPRVERIFLRDR